MAEPPETYPNPRGDNPWDNDAVHWLLEQPGLEPAFTRGVLMECLRRQPNQVERDPQRVERAAAFAARHGVEQRLVDDEHVGRQVVRLIRHDVDAPTYPW